MLFQQETPVPAHKVAEILDTSNFELSSKWNRAFADSEVLEQFPDEEGGGWVITARIKVSTILEENILRSTSTG